MVGIGLALGITPLGRPAESQVLARPGWAGSGVALEPWWLRAVFYRIDPTRFQDSDGDGRGDLAGVAQRLDYLQSLGVDALLLDGRLEPDDLEPFGDLVREASRHQLRVLVTGTPDLVAGPRDALLRNVRAWLGAGAAGIWVPKVGATSSEEASYAATLTALRAVVQSFPGDRVLLTDPAPVSLTLAPRPVRLTRRIDPNSFHAQRNGQLVTTAIFAVSQHEAAQPRAAALRSSLLAASEEAGSGSNGLLRFAAPPPTGSPDAAADAALLLASHGAVILDFGEEIGLNTYAPAPGNDTAAAALPVMQWTPSNHTPAPADPTRQTKTSSEPQFGTYHPYVPPPRGLAGNAPAPVKVAPDLNIPEDLPAPDTLPGFTAGALPAPPQGGDTRNVTTEDRDPRSLLNAYRQMIALHHSNATLRNGTQSVFNRDADDTLVWVRRAPAGSRTVANVVNAANLSNRPVTLSLDADLETEGMRAGALRPLFSSAPAATTGETTERLVLPPHTVFLGEIFHTGSLSEPAPRARRHGGRRSGRRVRR